MAEVILRPNGAVVPHPDNYNGTETIVGGTPQWGDESDETYADLRYDQADPGLLHGFRASFAAHDLPAGEVYGYEIFWRCMAITDEPPATSFYVRLESTTDTLAFGFGNVTGYTTATDAPTWLSTGSRFPDPSLATLLAAGDLWVAVVPDTLDNSHTRVYEAYIVITGDFLTRRRAHLRQYPRSPLRQWPPERSVQRSNRQGPGAYR